uniref:Metalloproteinase inhibitor 4 n=1 Tax=Periophthalmus magnuspinnatus TaxID=409849 RepID=A0A3B4AJU8_9GOBI
AGTAPVSLRGAVSSKDKKNLIFISLSCFRAESKSPLPVHRKKERAKISGEKIVSPSNSSSPYMKMIQYEIKMIKAKDIQYVYTPVFSSLCGVKLDSNNKAGYLLSGSMWSDGRISIGQCDLVESWDNLSLSQKKNLNYRYQMGCECRINTCYSVPCASTGDHECLWTDWLLDNSLNGEQARQYACIRRSDSSCSWYRGGPPPEKDFQDFTDP